MSTITSAPSTGGKTNARAEPTLVTDREVGQQVLKDEGTNISAKPAQTGAEPDGTQIAGSPPLPLRRSVDNSGPEATATPSRKPSSAPTSANADFSNKFGAQIGSFRSQDLANKGLSDFRRQYPAQAENISHQFVPIEIPGKGTYVRLRVGPFGTRDQASAYCFSITSTGGSCIVSLPR